MSVCIEYRRTVAASLLTVALLALPAGEAAARTKQQKFHFMQEPLFSVVVPQPAPVSDVHRRSFEADPWRHQVTTVDRGASGARGIFGGNRWDAQASEGRKTGEIRACHAP